MQKTMYVPTDIILGQIQFIAFPLLGVVVGWICPAHQIHVNLETQKVTLLGIRVFADGIS